MIILSKKDNLQIEHSFETFDQFIRSLMLEININHFLKKNDGLRREIQERYFRNKISVNIKWCFLNNYILNI